MSNSYKAYIADISDFRPDEENANRHTLRGRSLVHKGMERRGYARPAFAAKDGTVLGGNLSTLDVAVDIGLGEGKVLVVETSGNLPIIHKRMDVEPGTEAARLLALEDNRTAEISLDWNPAVVIDFLGQGLEIGDLWDANELSVMLEGAADSLLGGDGTPPPNDPTPLIDRAEELQKKWQVKPGDIFQMGQHFVICGDCREADTWERLLKAAGVEKVSGVFTSPPYAEQRKQQYGGVPTAEYVEWWEAVQGNVRANLAGDGSFFVNIKPHCEDGQRTLYVFDLVAAMVRRWGWRFVDELCWLHEDLPGAWPNRFRNGFEPVYHFCHSGSIKFLPKEVGHVSASVRNGRGGLAKRDGGNWTIDAPLVTGIAQPSNTLKLGGNTDGQSHAAAFPVALPTFFIKAYSDPGDVWLDPFCGSGTSIIAAHNEKRRGLGIERLEKYVSVILQRFVDTTGKDPVLLRS